jgi:hypothetical protein
MRDLLLTFSTPLLVLVIVGGSALLAMLATLVVRRIVPEQEHQANNEVAGFIFAAVGVIYGVLLAFMVLVVWQSFDEAQLTVEQEANTIVNVFRLGQEVQEPYGSEIQALAKEYAQNVINQEWDDMAFGRSSASVDDTLEKLWALHRRLHADKVEAQAHQEQFFDSMEALGGYRRIRLLDARADIPMLMWALLISGAVVTIGFTLFLRAPNWKAHLLMAAMFAGLVAFVLLLIIELDNPFAGDIKVGPLSFQQALDMFMRLSSN